MTENAATSIVYGTKTSMGTIAEPCTICRPQINHHFLCFFYQQPTSPTRKTIGNGLPRSNSTSDESPVREQPIFTLVSLENLQQGILSTSWPQTTLPLVCLENSSLRACSAGRGNWGGGGGISRSAGRMASVDFKRL